MSFKYVNSLSTRKTQFKYLGNDANDGPFFEVTSGHQLSGHAVQNWCLLRMLPVLIGEKIESPGKNQAWHLVLHLEEWFPLFVHQPFVLAKLHI